MATMNRLVEDLGNGVKRETVAPGAPANETENARFEQIGPFRQANVAASQSGVALTAGGVDTDAPTSVVAGRAGQIIGIVARMAAAVTAQSATIQATVGGTVVGDTAVLNTTTQQKVVDGFAAGPVSFNAGDLLGAKVTTPVGFTPTTDDLSVWLLVRWSA